MKMQSLVVTVGVLVCSAGAASAEVRTLTVQPFTGIESSAGVRVEATIGPNQSVVAEGDAVALDHLVIDVRNGVLHVSRNNFMGQGGARSRATVRVSAPRLTRFGASSGGLVSANGLAGADVEADGSSGGILNLAGQCGVLRVEASSGAIVRAEALTCSTAEAEASSGGQIEAFAKDRARADASSGGMVKIAGAPANVERHTSSGGMVRVAGAR